MISHSTKLGGASISLLHLLEAIDGDEFKISIYCRSDDPEFADRLEALGYHVIRGGSSPTPFAHFSGAEFPATSRSAMANLFRILRDSLRLCLVLTRGFDVVLANSMTLFWVGRIAGLFGCDTGLFHRETFVHGRWGFRAHAIKHELMHSFAGVAYISEFDRNQVGDDRPSSMVITDKVDLTLYASIGRSEARATLGLPERFTVLYLGGPSELKGARVLLRASEELESEIVVLMLGQRTDSETPSPEARNEGTNANTSVAKGRVIPRPHSNDVHLYYLASDIVVFPSTRPHQARPIYEAGAAKRLVVISDFPQTKEFAQDKVNCLEFPPGDARALAVVVNRVSRNPEEYRPLVRENWRRTARNHDLQVLSGEVERFLKGIS